MLKIIQAPTRFNRRFTVLIILLCAVIFVVEGCQPLRKKFTRKKKEDKRDEVVAILNPIAYPEESDSAQKKYAQHYSLRTVWFNSLLQTVREYNGGHLNEKNLGYLFGQITEHIKEMEALLVPEKQAELEVLLNEFSSVEKEFDKPTQMRDMNDIRRRLESLDKNFRKNFSPKVISGYLIKP